MLGDLFLKRYYTVFNQDDMKIGIAEANLDPLKFEGFKEV